MNSSQSQDKLSETVSQFWESALRKMDALAIPVVLERIQYWVGNQPDLTGILCDYVIQYGSQITDANAKAAVDTIVQQEIVENWESSKVAPYLNRIKQTLLSYDRRDSLLISYIQVLQRGKVPADNSSEQFVLLRSGLVEIERGSLKVASPLYAKVFDSTWVERQLPGITKPVAIIASKKSSDGPSSRSKLYSKLAIAACGLVVLGAAISSYMKESGGEAIAIDTTSDSLSVEQPALVDPGALAPSATVAPARKGSLAADKALFDNGEEHAKNSRWVHMMREFCQLSPESTYFIPAEKHLTQWIRLYPEDILIAKNIVVQEQGTSCTIADMALERAIQ